MPSLEYEKVFSSFMGKVKAYDFLDLSDTQIDEFLCNWIRSVKSKPYVRKLFSSIILDNDVREITYTMKYVLDEDSDKDFVIEVFAYGMIVEWLSPKIYNILNMEQFIGSSDEKWFSQSQHLKGMRELMDSSKKMQQSLISDRGYYWNTYLDGGQ